MSTFLAGKGIRPRSVHARAGCGLGAIILFFPFGISSFGCGPMEADPITPANKELSIARSDAGALEVLPQGDPPPDDRIRPTGDAWFCFTNVSEQVVQVREDDTACFRSVTECLQAWQRRIEIFSKYRAPFLPSRCERQTSAICYTSYDVLRKRHLYACFLTKKSCEQSRQYRVSNETYYYHHVSTCGPWD